MALDLSNNGFGEALVILGAAGLVGPAGLGAFVGDYPWLRFGTISDIAAIGPFAEFGIIVLLFSVGLELSFKRLWKMRTLVFGVGAADLLLPGLVIGTTLQLIGQD